MSSSLDFVIKLTDRVTAPLKRVQSQFKAFNATIAGSFKKIGGWGIALYAVAKSITGLLSPAEEMDRALKNASLGGVSSIDNLRIAARKFSSEYGTSAIDFVNSASSIKSALSGISDRDVPQAVSAMNLLSKSTGDSIGDATAYIEQMASNYSSTVKKMGQLDFARHAAGVSAYVKSNFNVSTKQLQGMMQSTKGAASNNGVGMGEQAVVLSMASKSLGSGAAGSYEAFYKNLNNASRELGMSFADANGKMLSMPDIITKIQGRFGKDLSKNIKAQQMLDKAFGRGSEIIKVLSKNSGELNKHMKEIGKGQNFKLMQKMAESNVAPLERINAQFMNIKESIGRALLPALQPVTDTISGIIGKFGRWLEMFPNLAKWIGIITVAFIGLTAVAAIFAIISAVISLLLSPIMLIVLAIGAVIAICWVFRKKIGKAISWVITKFQELWSNIKRIFNDFWDYMKNTTFIQTLIGSFEMLYQTACAIWDGISDAFSSTVEWLSDSWDSFIDFFTDFSFVDSFSAIGDSLLKMFSDTWKRVKNMGVAVINAIIEGLNYIPGVDIELLEYEKIEEQDSSPVNTAKSPIKSTVVSEIDAGGLSREIKNNKTQTIDNSKKIQSVTINNAKPMTPAQLQEWENLYAG